MTGNPHILALVASSDEQKQKIIYSSKYIHINYDVHDNRFRSAHTTRNVELFKKNNFVLALIFYIFDEIH